MILIFTTSVTSRVEYIFELLFTELLSLPVRYTNDAEYFRDYNGAKLNYSKEKQANELFFYAEDILFERKIKKQNFATGDYKKMKCIFFHNQTNAVFPFDPFAAAFYLISRYEEYLPHKKDMHGRFNHTSSIAFKLDFLCRPVVNIWVNWIAIIFKEKYQHLKIEKPDFKFIPTYDIDIAYSYKHKGFLRNFGGALVELKNLQFNKIWQRLKVLTNTTKDPYDTYKFQIDLQKKYNYVPYYFLLLGQYSKYDKNISSDTLAYQNLIQSLADYAKVGIHPSYKSFEKKELVKKEIRLLSSIIKREIKISRQHYILLNLPETYQHLLKQEIRKEFSMGYPSHIGFRASIASSFLFYDLTTNIKTPLRVYPFCLMDATLKYYMKLDTKEAFAKCCKMLDEVKKIQGLFIPIFHNHTLSETEGWENWSKFYENLIKKGFQKTN